MLEESVAEAGQLDVDAEWQTEVIRRLKKAEEEQEKQRQQLATLSRETHAKEEELVQMMMEVEGKHVSSGIFIVFLPLQNPWCMKYGGL